jgi:hypothetical protein
MLRIEKQLLIPRCCTDDTRGAGRNHRVVHGMDPAAPRGLNPTWR